MKFKVNPFDPESFKCFSEILNTDPKRFGSVLESQDDITRQLILSSMFFIEISLPLSAIMAELTNNIAIGDWFKDSDNLPQKFIINTEIFQFLKELKTQDLTDIINEFDIPNSQKQKLYTIVKESDENEFNKWIDEFCMDISKLSKFIYHFKNLKQNVSTDFDFIPSEDKALDFLHTISPDLAETLYEEKVYGIDNKNEDQGIKLWINFLNQFNLMPHNIISSSDEWIKSELPFPYYIQVINLKKKPILGYIEKINFNEEGKDGNVIMKAFNLLNDLNEQQNHQKKDKNSNDETSSDDKIKKTSESQYSNNEDLLKHKNFNKESLNKIERIFLQFRNHKPNQTNKLYHDFLIILYDVLRGDLVIESEEFISGRDYINCSLTDFCYILGDENVSRNEISENPQIFWINRENQADLRAFLLSLYSKNGWGTNFEKGQNPGRKTGCYSYNGDKIILSRDSTGTANAMKKWRNVIEKCIALTLSQDLQK